MLLPLGGDGFPQDVPTQWALEMRKWTIVLWLALMALLIGKLFVLEIFGCLSILCVVAIGYFVPWGKPPMQQIWIIFWGAICAFNCVMDLILAILHYHQYQNGTYGRNRHYYGNGYNEGEHGMTPMEKWKVKMALYAIIIGFLLPVVEFLVAWLCYRLYKDHQSSHDEEYGRLNHSNYGSSAAGNNYGSLNSQYQQGPSRAGAPAAARDQRSFHAFQGQGVRLGDRA